MAPIQYHVAYRYTLKNTYQAKIPSVEFLQKWQHLERHCGNQFITLISNYLPLHPIKHRDSRQLYITNLRERSKTLATQNAGWKAAKTILQIGKKEAKNNTNTATTTGRVFFLYYGTKPNQRAFQRPPHFP